jgi:hypothetical protein
MPFRRSSPGSRGRPARALTAVVIAAGLSVAYLDAARGTPAAQGRSGPHDWRAFRADLALTHHRLRGDGREAGPSAPAISFHIERLRRPAGWTTTMTLKDAERPEVLTRAGGLRHLDNPFLITRMEADDGSAEVRLYDRSGKLVQPFANPALKRLGLMPDGLLPGPALDSDHRPGTPPDWIAALVATREDRASRRAVLQRRFGASAGTVNGRDRYLLDSGNERQEVLVDSAADVPIEINVAREGSLVSHTVVTYAPYAGDVLARRAIHREDALAGSDERLVTDVELTGLSLELEVHS